VLGLDAIKLSPPSVLVTGNPALADVSALARLAGCASGDPSGTTGIVLEVHPADQGLKCTLVAWKQVCDYIAAGSQAGVPLRAHPLPECLRLPAGLLPSSVRPRAEALAAPCWLRAKLCSVMCRCSVGSLLAACQPLSHSLQTL